MSAVAVTVMVPTFRRPEALIRAVQSLFSQTLADDGFAIVIVDNCPDASAADAIRQLKADCPQTIELTALSETEPGVATARNTAMTAVRTDLVAFLDDDQTAPTYWLSRLLDNLARYPASVTFGPVRTALPDSQTRHRAYFEAFFARDPKLANGYVEETFGIGNALVDFSTLTTPGAWFDTRMNEIGGEDDLLFELVKAQNGQFAWAADADVLEHPDPKRISLSYTLRRAFAYGQGPVVLARVSKPPKYFTWAMWTVVGLGKTVWHGAQWIALELIRHPNRAFQLDATLRGMAKVLWFVHLRFYGAAIVTEPVNSNSPATSTAGVKDKPVKVA